MKARVRCEAILFAAFLIGGLLLVKFSSLPIDRTTWWIVFGIFVVVFLFELCFVCPYEHAKGLLANIATLEERIKPRLKICGGKMEKSFMVDGKAFYLRPILELEGAEPLYNVEARVTQIRKDREILRVDEPLQLAMHPAASPTLPILTPGTTGLVDLIKADSNERPELALVYPYRFFERGLIASGHTYEIDIRVSYLTAANNALSQDCTAVFRWEGNPSASRFEITTQPSSVPNKEASPHND